MLLLKYHGIWKVRLYEKVVQKAQETKRRIMTSAQKLFHKKGFEATSM